MNYAKIKPNDVANGEGIVVSLWTQGCPHRCEGCHNPETWSFKQGKKFGEKQAREIIKLLDKDKVNRNLSILGGEPLCKENINGVLALCTYVKALRPATKIYVWTGYLFEDLLQKYPKIFFADIDVLIDGRFEIDKKDLSLKMRGSSNQRVIDVQKTLKENKIILY